MSATEAEQQVAPMMGYAKLGSRRSHHQAFAELYASEGSFNLAVAHFCSAVEAGLTDLSWCLHAPPLRGIASFPEFQAARRIVERRLRPVHELEKILECFTTPSRGLRLV